MPVTEANSTSSDYAMSSSAAQRYDKQFDDIQAEAEQLLESGTDMVDASSTLGKMVTSLRSDLAVTNRRYYTTNSDGLNEQSYTITNAARNHMEAFVDEANKGSMNVENVLELVQALDNVLPDGKPATVGTPTEASGSTEPTTPASKKSTSGESNVGDLSDVADLLGEAHSATGADAKADKLGSAIDALIAALKGESSEKTDSTPAGDRIEEALETIGEATGTGEAAAPSETTPSEPTPKKIWGDELQANVTAGGAALSSTGHAIGVKGGNVDSEIDGDEFLTFTPPEGTADGARIDVKKLFSGTNGNDAIQEMGTVEITRPDGSVETQKFYGTGSGNNTVEIKGEFTQLTFRAGDGKASEDTDSRQNSDFAIDAIEYGVPQTAGGSAAETPATSGSGEASFDPAALSAFLESLGKVVDAIKFSDMPPEKKEKALEAITDLMEGLTSSMGESSAGGSQVTGSELATTLADLKDVLPSIQEAGGEDLLETVADGLDSIVSGSSTAGTEG